MDYSSIKKLTNDQKKAILANLSMTQPPKLEELKIKKDEKFEEENAFKQVAERKASNEIKYQEYNASPKLAIKSILSYFLLYLHRARENEEI